MKTRVIIDGVCCDLEAGFAAPRNLLHFSDEECGRGGRHTSHEVDIVLPSSPTNDALLCYAADAHAIERFNQQEHTATIEVDGVALLEGQAALVAVRSEGSKGVSYDLRIRRRGDNWRAKMHRKRLADTALDYSVTLNAAAIERSWRGEQKVRFLPVHFDQYVVPYDSRSLYPPQHIIGVDNYMPFISVYALVRQIFAEAGYEVESRFMESDLWHKLYISGRYEQSGRSAERLDAVAGVCAGRTGEATTQADSAGRAYMSRGVLVSSLGSFVDTAQSSVAPDLYNHNGALDTSAVRLNYKSPIAATVKFELQVKYTTDYLILSRDRLRCFDSIYLGPNCDMTFRVANTFADRRGSLNENTEYHCIVFDHNEGSRYRVVAQTSEGEVVLATFASRSAKVTIPLSMGGVMCRLDVADRYGNFGAYPLDWAMYDGYVEDRGSIDVEFTVCTTPEKMGPSITYYLDTMYMHGAEAGQSITLHKGCRLRTLFSPTPSLGSVLTAADVMHYDCTQEEFIDALQQLFNLRICADRQGERLYIEPRAEFYAGEVFDLSDRILISEQIRAEELAAYHAATCSLGYRAESDGAVGRFDLATGGKLGRWSGSCDSALSADEHDENNNPLFCPTLSARGIFASAPSAALLQVGDRDSDLQGDNVMRIVRYEGLQTLRSSESWGFPSYGRIYPLVAFHYPASQSTQQGAAIEGEGVVSGPAEPFTLCFESRDGATGLHSYYGELDSVGRRRLLHVALRLMPEEVHNIVDAGGAEPSLRSRFRLGVGEKALYRLYAIEGYDAVRGIAYCTMERTEQEC